jgi:lipopolysaccharide transport system ATP-binding protein
VQDILSELNPFGGRQSPGRQRQGSAGKGSNGLRPEEFWAVKDVSFELRRGECLGLIGRNGAGKTTLLKILNGLIKPDKGRIEMRGRIGAIIALGAGFNPVLSGRENIYVNGAILGLTNKEIREQIDAIIDFAEIRDFIDSPVQSYSSGMLVRLGFSVATTLQPDVLLLDEVLAVGDISFRHKCYHRINKLIKNSAVIFVSHSMEQVGSVTSSIGLMQRGNFHYYPRIEDGIQAYNDLNMGDSSQGNLEHKPLTCYPPVTNAKLRILDPVSQHGGKLDVEVELHCTEPVPAAVISFTGVNQNEQSVLNWNSSRQQETIDLPRGGTILRFRIDPLLLHDGNYSCNINIMKKGFVERLVDGRRVGEFSVRSPYKPSWDIPYLPKSSMLELQPLPDAATDPSEQIREHSLPSDLEATGVTSQLVIGKS